MDPDQGSQNLADPTDPDPKHCLIHRLCTQVTLYAKKEMFLIYKPVFFQLWFLLNSDLYISTAIKTDWNDKNKHVYT